MSCRIGVGKGKEGFGDPSKSGVSLYKFVNTPFSYGLNPWWSHHVVG